MGVDMTACYRLRSPGADLTPARIFLASLGIEYAGIVSHYVFTPEGRLDELLGLPPGIRLDGSRFASLEADWTFFAQAAESGALSLNSKMQHKNFQFTLGFVAAPHGSYILLQFESNDVYDLGLTLPAYGMDARRFFTRLFQTLAAQSFVYATDVYFEDLLELLWGTFPPGETQIRPWMAIAVPQVTVDLLRADAGQELLIEGTSVLSCNYFGAPDID